jgi:hypothetical protein
VLFYFFRATAIGGRLCIALASPCNPRFGSGGDLRLRHDDIGSIIATAQTTHEGQGKE